jgi:hypothetical protein
MARTLDGVSCEFPPEVKELAFSVRPLYRLQQLQI